MPPILEEKKFEYSALIVALLYIVKTLRNKEITRIEFSESLDYYHYLDPNFKKTDDSFDETNVLDILEFRNKYENQFIITIIYLCFLNCIHIVGSNIDSSIYEIFNNAEFFLLLIRVSIKKTQGLFTNLQAPQHSSLWNSILSFVNINQTLTGLYADLKGIIVKVHSIIFKEILLSKNKHKSKITDDYIINLLFTSKTATPTDNITNFSNHVNEIMKYFAISKIKNESAEKNKPVTEEIIKTYKKMNKFLFPMFPIKMKFVYGSSGGKITGGGSSEIINIFELTCNRFNIDHTKMLEFIKKLYNESISYRNNGLTSKQPLNTGLTSKEMKALQPNVFNNFSTRRISTYSGGKRKSMKKYRGGVVVAGAVAGLSLAQGATVYVTTASLNAFTAAGGTGLVATAGGVSTLNGAYVTLVTVTGAGASAVAAPLLLAAGAVLVGVTVYSLSGTSKTQQEQEKKDEEEQQTQRLGQKDTLEQEQTLEQENQLRLKHQLRLEHQQRLEQIRQRRQRLDQQNKKRSEKEHQEKLDEIVKKEIEEQNEKKLDEIIDKELEQQKEEKIEKERQKLKDFNEFLKKAKNDAETTSDAVTYGSELALDPKIIRTINFIKSLEKQQIDDGIAGIYVTNPNRDWGQKVILDTPVKEISNLDKLSGPNNSNMFTSSFALLGLILVSAAIGGIVYKLRKPKIINTENANYESPVNEGNNEENNEENNEDPEQKNLNQLKLFDKIQKHAFKTARRPAEDTGLLVKLPNDKTEFVQHDSQTNKNESRKLAKIELAQELDGGYRRYNKTKKNKRNKKDKLSIWGL